MQVIKKIRLDDGNYITYSLIQREKKFSPDDKYDMDEMEIKKVICDLDRVMQGQGSDEVSTLGGSIRNGADTLSGAETMKEGDEGWLDFKAIKEKADVRAVLSHFGLLEYLEERGAELSGWCPFGDEHGKKDSFSMNVEKKTFQCFACKARGSLLDFVAKFRNIDLREAAQWVASLGGGAVRDEKSGGRPYGKSKGESVARENMAETSEPARYASRSDASGDISAVMSFSLASRLIIANEINPAHLLVVNMEAAGIEWKKAKRD